MIRRRPNLTSLLIFLCLGLEGFSQSEQSVKILTIGNSFADDATRHLESICRSSGVALTLGKANLGGSSLKRHASHLEAFQRDASDAKGRPYQHPQGESYPRQSLVELLQSETWDYVSIQQFSGDSYQPDTYEPHASKLVATIRSQAPQAQILLLQTWAYRHDHPYFEPEDLNQEIMHRKLVDAYDGLASKHHLQIVPLSEAFQIARGMPRFHQVIPDPDFNYNDPPTDQLPDQKGSLVKGWFWAENSNTGEKRLKLDAKHCNARGSYLGACVLYEIITDKNSRDLAWRPDSLSEKEAEDLRHAARKAVATREADLAFIPIFNGKDLEDWDYDPRYWRIEDGTMVGEVTQDLILDRNSFMIWKGDPPSDFELKVEYRVSRYGNSGISYRNARLKDHPYSLSGYQADIDGRDHDPRLPRQRYAGQAWEERGRRFLARRGQIVQIDETGQSIILGSLGDIDELESHINEEDWNEYYIIVRDNILTHIINGQVMSIVIDDDPVNRRLEGLIGVQVHTGPPQKIEFRNFRLKGLQTQ